MDIEDNINNEKWLVLLGDKDIPKLVAKARLRRYKIMLITNNYKNEELKSICDFVISDRNIWNNNWPQTIVGVVNCCAERYVVMTAEIIEKYNLSGISVEQASLLSDKQELKKRLIENNIITPSYKTAVTFEEAEKAVKSFEGSVAIKPVDNSSQRGVRRINGRRLLEYEYNESVFYSKKGILVVEQLIEGDEFEITCSVVNGQAYPLLVNGRMRVEDGQGFGVATGYYTVDMDEKFQLQINDLCSKVVEALEIDSAVISLQIIRSKEGIYVLEVMGRHMGGGIRELILVSTGIDMFNILIDFAEGCMLPTWKEIKIKRVVAMLFITSVTVGFKCGTVRRIEGLKELRKMPGVFLVSINIKEGEYISSLCTASDRYGSIVVLGKKSVEAIERGNKAIAKLKIHTCGMEVQTC